MQKLYCYVDESGQDTKGKLFVVVVIVQEINNQREVEESLEEIERKAGKKLTKWKQENSKKRVFYLQQLLTIHKLKNAVFYSIYFDSKEYLQLVALTIAKAILYTAHAPYNATIIIDGLNKKEKERVRGELKKLQVRYRTIRGMKDEQSAFLRLADKIAGFLRDHNEQKRYTLEHFRALSKTKIVRKL